MLQYLSDIDMPKGVVVISHGSQNTAVKYDEVAYYFLRKAIMYIFGALRHGRSYRLTADPSLVHSRYMEKIYPRFLKHAAT